MHPTFAISVALRLFDNDRFYASIERLKSSYAFTFRLMLFCALLVAVAIPTNAQTTQTYSAPGTSTFIVPNGVTNINVQAWGGGGCSGNNTTGRARGGGGGGAYTEGTINVTPGTSLTIVVGEGGIYNKNNTANDDGGSSSVGVLVAKGGSRGIVGNNVAINGGFGGTASANPGGITSFLSYAGGNGGNGYVAGDHGGGGGGGASASAAGAGTPAGNGTSGGIGGAGGNANAGGGDGGRGSNNDWTPDSQDGNSPGGGGGGRADDRGADRNGAPGQVIITWTIPAGYCSGNALSVFNSQNIPNPDDAIGAPDGNGAHLNETNDALTLALINSTPLSSGGSVDVTWQRISNNNSSIRVEVSELGTSWTMAGVYTNITRNSWTTQSIALSINTRYIRFTSNNGYDLDIDAVSYFTPCGVACIIPVVQSVTGGGNYCTGAGLPVGLSGSETGVDYQLYLGATPQGLALPGTGTALDFGNQVTAGTYTVTATRLSGGCAVIMNGNALIAVDKPIQPSPISGSTTSCIGSTQTYSVINVPGETFNWTFPSGWTQTGGGTSNSVTVTAGSAIGNITVTPSSACGPGPSRSLTITATLPVPLLTGTITGTATVCPGVTGLGYSIPAAANATSYLWTIPTGWTITGGATTSSITATAGAAGQNGDITVTAINSCGASAVKTLAVTVSPLPTPVISANYCIGGGNIQLTANGGGVGASYLWSTDETTPSILVNIAGQYSVEVTNTAGCSATAVYSVSTELVTNGDFSAGNTGFTHSTYGFRADVAGNTELNPEGYYGVGPDPQAYHGNFWGRDHTTGTGNFMIVNGFPGSPQPVVWTTTVAVVPGVSYYFSAWALSLNSVGNYAVLQFRVNNTLVGTTAPLPARPNNNNPPYNWTQFYGTWTAPAGVFSVPIDIVDFQTAASGNDFGLDDISFATLAPLPAKITPTTNAASGICSGQTLQLSANLTGGKAPYTFAWTGPAGFTSTLENPTIPNATLANAGIYTLTITDGYGCSPVISSTLPAKIVPSPNCSITGPASFCPGNTGNTYSAPAGMATYAWSITGNGTITGLTNGATVDVTAGNLNNKPLTLSLTLTNATGCTSTCQQVVQVGDNIQPTFTLPLLNAGYCVEYVSDALYNPGQENTPLDITYIRPDYYLFANGSPLLNLGSVFDNCALAVNPIAWTIDFGNNGSIELSGTGQLSTYGSDIQFPLGINRISYTVTDAVGNVSVQFVDLTVTPRPIINNNF